MIRTLKWFGYINKRRFEDNLLNELEEVYGKKSIFVLGDWNGKGRIRRLGMPNMGTRKLISRKFKTLLINEHNSSALCWKTHKTGKNRIANAKDKNGNLKYNIKLHSVITFEMGKNNVGCINRDYNACKNFENQVKEIITTGKKAECFAQKIKQPPIANNNKKKEKEKKISKKGKGCKKAFMDEQKNQTLKKKRGSKLNVP